MKAQFALEAHPGQKMVDVAMHAGDRPTEYNLVTLRSQAAVEQFVTALQAGELITEPAAAVLLQTSRDFDWLPAALQPADVEYFASSAHLDKVAEIKEFIKE